MDEGLLALLIGLAAVGLIAVIPRSYLKALGGLLIVITVCAIVIDALRLLSR